MLRAQAGRPHPTSLGTRLLVGGLVITIVLVSGVSAFLLVSRGMQAEAAVRAEAANRAATAEQLLTHVTQPLAQSAASSLAASSGLRAALGAASLQARAVAVSTLFSNGSAASLAGSRVAVLDSGGQVVYTDECGPGVSDATCSLRGAALLGPSTPSVAAALGEGGNPTCARGGATTACPPGYEGVELIAGRLPAFDVAVPVRAAGRFAGAVVFSTTLQAQFHRLGAAILYTPVLVTPNALYRFDPERGYAMTVSRVPAALAPSLAPRSAPPGVVETSYPTPRGAVTAAFTAVAAPGGGRAGWLGVEVPATLFAGQTADDERTIVLIGVTAVIVVFTAIVFFTTYFVRRPIELLERGVRRIADGDLSADVPIRSNDELGRLGTSVNRMRAQLASYIGHLDTSLDRLEHVSHALTETASGLPHLEQSVLAAAMAIAGPGSRATLFGRSTEGLMPVADATEPAVELSPAGEARILAGEAALDQPAGILAVPMMYRGQVRGALAVSSASTLSDTDAKALTALANNAAVAMQNARLLEQERQTVQRLRELDTMKSEFLSTSQHELRTPVLAISGGLELLVAAWQQLDDDARLDLVHDMEISTRQLGDIVENIVVFSLLSSDPASLVAEPVDVAAAVGAAVDWLRGNFKAALPVNLTLSLEPGRRVLADEQRFERVLRALLDNAVKFTPAGGNVHVVSRRSGDCCRIDVIDDGIGIAPALLPRIFEQFSQVDGSWTRRHGGLGMGLALVHRLTEAYGARVSVSSTPGAGSCFTLEWPAAEAQPAAAPASAR